MSGGLAAWLDGPGHLLDELDELVRDDPETGRDGWVWLLDAADTDVAWLPWLGQFAGVVVDPQQPEEQQRRRVAEAPRQRRGTVAAFRAAARLHLTGTRSVNIEERTTETGDAHPGHVRVTTFLGETPDPARVERELRRAKPAGLILYYRTLVGVTYQQLVDQADGDSYTDVASAIATYQAATEQMPEG